MMMCVVRGRRAGFTLIEIMIVVAIIAILAGIVVPNFVEAKEESCLQTCKKNILTIVQAVECARVRYSQGELVAKGKDTGGGGMYGDIGDFLMENGYLSYPPICPTGISTVIPATEGSLFGSYVVRIFKPGYTTGSHGFVLCYGSHNVGGQRGVQPRFGLGGYGLAKNVNGSYGWVMASKYTGDPSLE